MSHYPKDVPFEVPQGWAWTTIGDILINRDGERVPVSSAIRMKQKAKVYDYYGAAGVIDKVNDYLFNERLLLVGEDGANLLSRSKDNAFFAEGKYWVNNHAHIIDATDKKMLDYIALYINAIPLDPYVTGSAQPKLNQDNLNRIIVPLPPLAEQFRILHAIEEYKRIVSSIEDNQVEIQDAIDHIRQTVLGLAITGKLTPQDPFDEPAIDLLRRINPDFNPSHNLHYCDYLPKGWCLMTFGQVAEYINGRAFKPEEWEKEGIPIVRIQNLNDSLMAYNYSTKTFENRYLLHHGDLLFAWAASLDAYIWHGEEAWLNQHIFKVIPKDCILPKYLYYTLKAKIHDFYQRSHGSGMVHITRNTFLKELFLLPPLNEQARIIVAIEELYYSMDSLSACFTK